MSAGRRDGWGWGNRLFAHARKEVPAAQLEAFRRAGSGVFDLHLVAERHRTELRANGQHPWEASPATASLLICAWNARVHQTLGAELLDADYRADPKTAGYVPAVTAGQAWAFFEPVERWLNAGRRAAVTPDFWVGDEVELPAALPQLLSTRWAPRVHLRGLLTAADAVDALLEEALGAVLGCGDPPKAWRGHLTRINELVVQARSALRYAQALWHPAIDRDLSDFILRHLQPTLVLEHHLGQFLALPELVDRYRIERKPETRWINAQSDYR